MVYVMIDKLMVQTIQVQCRPS